MDIEKFNGIEIELDYQQIIKETCNNLADNIKETAKQKFKGKGDYANSWTFKIEKDKNGKDYGVVYNKEHYRLTHLLEHGHIIKNKYGTYGKVSPKPHIKPNFDKSKEEYIKEMSDCKFKILTK